MWHCTPLTVSTPFSEPRRPFLIVSPKRATDVGSPMMQASMPVRRGPAVRARRPRCRRRRRPPHPTSAAAPASRGAPAPRRRTRSAAVTIAATDVFMSAAPRPNRNPSRSVGVNGSLVHASTGPGGTTSTWPARQTSGAPAPCRAQRFRTAPRSIRSQAKPARCQAAPHQLQTAGIVRRDRAAARSAASRAPASAAGSRADRRSLRHESTIRLAAAR